MKIYYHQLGQPKKIFISPDSWDQVEHIDVLNLKKNYGQRGKVVKSLKNRFWNTLLEQIFESANFFNIPEDLLGRHDCWQNLGSVQWHSSIEMAFLFFWVLLSKIFEIFDWPQIGPGWSLDQKLCIRGPIP